ncbi:MAG TPA: hypothetical protein VFH47_04970 [Candidatus Thermoplasmatota archaeon]|nr:hypothetical protein [Candidatus Thermoplasmatota archaeon]
MPGLPASCYLPSVLDRKLADAFGDGAEAAARILAPVSDGPGRIRVHLACVRLARGSLEALRDLAARPASAHETLVAQAEDDGYAGWIMSGDAW